MNPNTSHVMALMTANDCSHCKDFSSQVIVLEKGANDLGLRFVRVSLQSMRDKTVDTSRYPVGLNRCKKWFPAVFLFKGSDWDGAMKNTVKDYPLVGKVFNGSWDDITKGPQLLPVPQYSMTAQEILAWAAESLKDPMFRSVNATSLIRPLIDNSSHSKSNASVKVPTTGNKSICDSLKIVSKYRG